MHALCDRRRPPGPRPSGPRQARVAVGLVLLLGLLPGCEETSCTPTQTEAAPATLADAGAPTASAVLEARLTAAGAPLPGATLEFDVRRRGGEFSFVAEGATGADGVARVDLKEEAGRILAGATADAFRARFDGDGVHCSSSDEAEVRVLGT